MDEKETDMRGKKRQERENDVDEGREDGDVEAKETDGTAAV